MHLCSFDVILLSVMDIHFHNESIMSKIISIKSFPTSSLMKIVKTLLLNDCAIAVPTDTIYGLAVNAKSQLAIERLYDIKGRDCNKPVAICLGDLEEISQYSEVTITGELLRELLPGAVTLIFRRSPELNGHLNPTSDLVGIRIPDYDFIREMCRHCGPIALTSANITNKSSCSNIKEFSELWPKINAIFDGGTLDQIDPDRLGSTIVDLSVKGKYRIVRDGCIYDQVTKLLNKYNLERIF